MPKIKLTVRAVEALEPDPDGRQTLFWDSELAGLGVLVSGKTERKTYVVQRDLPGGRTRRVTLGPTNVLSLDAARERARGVLAEFYQGKDPKQAARGGSATLRQTLDAYLAKSPDLSGRTVETYTRLVSRHLEPWLDRAMGSITPGEVDDLHDKIAKDVARATGGARSGATVANDAMRCLRLLYNWAASRDDSMPRNPVRIRKREWHRESPVRRPIPAARLAEWHAAVMALAPLGADYLRLMLWTGLRRRTAAALRWEFINFDERTLSIPASAMKGGRRGLTLPLTDVVLDLLVARRALGNAGGWVFPGHGRSGHIQDPRAFLDAVKAKTGIEFSSHDLRRTFVTVAESCDLSHYALKSLVAHAVDEKDKPKTSADVTELYIEMSVERLRGPAQRVSDRLSELCGVKAPAGGNVAKFR
jgi:integrase